METVGEKRVIIIGGKDIGNAKKNGKLDPMITPKYWHHSYFFMDQDFYGLFKGSNGYSILFNGEIPLYIDK